MNPIEKIRKEISSKKNDLQMLQKELEYAQSISENKSGDEAQKYNRLKQTIELRIAQTSKEIYSKNLKLQKLLIAP